MANILTADEAANVLRCDPTDPNLVDLLDLVDDYIKTATGYDWAADTEIQPKAKSAARMLLVRWHEDPGGMAAGAAIDFGLTAVLTQLEALALHYVIVEGIPSSGYIYLPQAHEGDKVKSVTGLTTGHTGDQSAAFETVISEHHYIKQIATDLDECFFRIYLEPLSEQ